MYKSTIDYIHFECLIMLFPPEKWLVITLTTVEARGGDDNSCTFIRKNVMLVRRSTVDFKSCRRAGSDAGKVF